MPITRQPALHARVGAVALACLAALVPAAARAEPRGTLPPASAEGNYLAAEEQPVPVVLRKTFVLSKTQALTLGEAYRIALENDANLAAARATADARRERVPQSRAQLLPNVSANMNRFDNSLDSVTPNPLTGAPVSSHRDYFSSNRALVVRQPLFRPAQFADLKQAKAQVADAEAQLDREVQNLSVRVGTAYLQALLAEEQLSLVAVQKNSYTTQLDAARKGLAAGSGTRTDIDEAQARLDLVVAQELEARQNVDFTRRTLQMLIDLPFGRLASLDESKMPLLPPTPALLQDWVDRTFATSPEVRSLTAQREASRQEVAKQQAGHMPTLDAIAQWSKSKSDSVTSINTAYENKQIGFQLNVPIFAGGLVNSQVRQAQADLERATQSLESLKRDLALRVEKEFRGVTEGVLRVRALEQAVRSAQTASTSAQRSFQGGARTQLDVLVAEENRLKALRDLADARFAYLLARIRLLALAGEATEATIGEIDSWLKP